MLLFFWPSLSGTNQLFVKTASIKCINKKNLICFKFSVHSLQLLLVGFSTWRCLHWVFCLLFCIYYCFVLFIYEIVKYYLLVQLNDLAKLSVLIFDHIWLYFPYCISVLVPVRHYYCYMHVNDVVWFKVIFYPYLLFCLYGWLLCQVMFVIIGP